MSIKTTLKKRRAEIYQIASKHGASNIRMFGSVSNETDRPDSDIDLLIDLDNDRSLLDLSGLILDLQQLLKRKVDITTENGLHWYIREKIIKDAEPL